jgi:hypothetical protein
MSGWKPPAAMTFPSGSSRAKNCSLGTESRAVLENLLVAGSKISEGAGVPIEPVSRTFPSLMSTAWCLFLEEPIAPAADQVRPTGLKSSAVIGEPPPPAASTRPSGRVVRVWPALGTDMLATAAHVLVLGSNRAHVACGAAVASVPPQPRTRPSSSFASGKSARAWGSLPCAIHLLNRGMKSDVSIVGLPVPPSPPAIRSDPSSRSARRCLVLGGALGLVCQPSAGL